MQAKARLLAGGLMGALLIAGCHKEPKGQVVAIVNGDEISIQEVNAELQGVRIPDNVDRTLLRKQVLERIIDRTLIVQKAKDQGLDKTFDYVSQNRRFGQNLLAGMLAQKVAQTVPAPDDRDVLQYMAENPSQFAQRERLLLDQLQFQPPKDIKKLKSLRDAHTLDAVAAQLQTLGLTFARGKSVIDTGKLDLQLMKAINALPPGEAFVLPSNGQLVASVIVSREAIDTPPEVARAAAQQAVRRRALLRESQAQVALLRTSSKIQYQAALMPN